MTQISDVEKQFDSPTPQQEQSLAREAMGGKRKPGGAWSGIQHRGLLWMLLPGAIYFLIFHFVPMVGLVVAFKDYRMTEGIVGSPWTGLANFRNLFFNEQFPNALRNTVVIAVLRLTFGFFAPIGLALLLNELRVQWFKRSIQTITYLPFFFSWVILGGIFLMLFSTTGPMNSALAWVGIDPVPFLTSGPWFIVVLVVTGVWQSVGYGAVIYLAALAGVEVQLYEAAAIDGAGRWKQTRHITLPGLTPVMIVLFILSVGQLLNAGFDQIYNMYNPLVFESTDIIDTYVLRQLQGLDFGVATAAGLFKSVVGLMLIVGTNALANRLSGGEQGLW